MVEDEICVKKITRLILHSCGYRLVTASDGIEALSVFMEHRDALTMIMTDLKMPRLGGMELVREIRDMDGNIPIVVVSGYLDDAVVAELQKFGVTDFLNKPFTGTQLLDLITEVSGRAKLPRRLHRASALTRPERIAAASWEN